MTDPGLIPPHFEILCGSERAGGNTEQLADHIAWLLHAQGCSAGIVRLREFRITPCGACGECNLQQTGCHINDDMPAIVARMRRADAIVYAAPVHGYGMAHPMQVFIER